ncbi:MAG: hypothetical protein Q8P46_04970 [Hyphomicrobiales bacterium]|nr:hypothetical protein [Hyphomicrobiales bacterium]
MLTGVGLNIRNHDTAFEGSADLTPCPAIQPQIIGGLHVRAPVGGILHDVWPVHPRDYHWPVAQERFDAMPPHLIKVVDENEVLWSVIAVIAVSVENL